MGDLLMSWYELKQFVDQLTKGQLVAIYFDDHGRPLCSLLTRMYLIVFESVILNLTQLFHI